MKSIMFPAYQYIENFTLSNYDKKLAGKIFLNKKSFFERVLFEGKEFLNPKTTQTSETKVDTTLENISEITTTTRPVIKTNIFTIESKKASNKKSSASRLILLGNTPCLENFQVVLKSKLKKYSLLKLKYVKQIDLFGLRF